MKREMEVVDILMVEDNPQDAELAIRALRKRNLANGLFLVKDGEEALDFMFGRGRYEGREASGQPKVVLLDLRLPKLNGLEVLKALKAEESTRCIPVVIVTSSHDDPDIRAAYELGASSCVVKPVEFEPFTEAMSQIGYYWLLVNKTTK